MPGYGCVHVRGGEGGRTGPHARLDAQAGRVGHLWEGKVGETARVGQKIVVRILSVDARLERVPAALDLRLQ
jgi:hypothetical protein